jgi:hypothetical protein
MFKTAIITTLATASAIKLTPDNWDSETAGKTVFIKMFAPCKKEVFVTLPSHKFPAYL